ncbi:hypothetical protein [Azospirillum doebereinerae]|uniref:Uncharacterized protein n=1 Tax=Azospirillum doebereinerae TaxID=92933 RepID=A0A3S0V5L2_9PROT|nr:hypothetical protein EJ913_16350 [Azospirillum doebereinerae]
MKSFGIQAKGLIRNGQVSSPFFSAPAGSIAPGRPMRIMKSIGTIKPGRVQAVTVLGQNVCVRQIRLTGSGDAVEQGREAGEAYPYHPRAFLSTNRATGAP